MKSKYDVVVIGGGPGGTPAAIQLSSQGKSVLLVEKSGKLGGACLFVGCIPSKIIRHWADEFTARHTHLDRESWTPDEREEAWGRIQQAMRVILERRSAGAMQVVNRLPTLDFAAGHAEFVSDREIAIEEEELGRRDRVAFDRAIIATGARSFVPPLKGDGVQAALTSEVLFSQEALPESMLIVGGGPIGVELSQMFGKLGVKCTIIELLDSILSSVVDPQAVAIILKELERVGVEVYTSSRVEEINKAQERFNVVYTDADGQRRQRDFEKVLIAIGKVPNVEGLNLEKAGIEADRKGIAVNEFLETTAKGIYATGDVITGPKFAHVAAYEARVAAMNIMMGNKQTVDFSKNSWVLFTEPEIATAGLTETQAAQQGIDVITGVYDYKVDAAAQVANAPQGYLKFVVNRGNGKIVGVDLCARHAASLVGEAALIVSGGLTLRDVAQAIHPHPTMTEAFGVLALKMLSGQ